MKNIFKKIAGVTLLEVMLVLAIAAMIIVMSVRYYQTATSNQQANAVIAQVQAIVAAADQLAQATGSYTTAVDGSSALNSTAVQALLPAAGMMTPWGQAITIGGVTSSAFTITLPTTPASVCPLVRSKIMANNHFTGTAPTACSAAPATTNLVLTYTANI